MTHIRPATPHDRDAVFALVSQLGDTYTVEREAFDSSFDEAIDAQNHNVLLVAENNDNRVIAYAMMTVSRLMYTRDDAAQIQELIVDENARGTGVGSRLVYAVENICRDRGISQLAVAASRAPGFYDRLDYRSTADFLKKVFDSEH